MLASLIKKIRSIGGESIAETLIAILIAALGAAALASMVLAATSITSTNQQMMDSAYSEESAIAQGNKLTDQEYKAIVSGLSSSSSPEEAFIDIDVYAVEDGEFIRYAPKGS